MSRTRIAIPSELPGGLNADLHDHFGHCVRYTLVDVQDGYVVRVETIPGLAHGERGCLVAVEHLARQGVTDLIAVGMGERPLKGFGQAGIRVHRGEAACSVNTAVMAFIRGDLPAFAPEFACDGGPGR
jgi:predicted Fe-Mo cluster-binding NifX family protein